MSEVIKYAYSYEQEQRIKDEMRREGFNRFQTHHSYSMATGIEETIIQCWKETP